MDPRIDAAVAYLRGTLGATRVGATGYCFGGRYAFRRGAEEGGADAVFAAHPSLLGDDEVLALVSPASVAAAGEFFFFFFFDYPPDGHERSNPLTNKPLPPLLETDSLMDPARRVELEQLLQDASVPYQFTLYSGTTHGFGVRANVSDPQERFGKESAFLQAVRWFDAWA